MKRLETKRAGLNVWHADALELCASLPESSVSLIATDPPYNGVKRDEAWDNQWKTDADFLAWLGDLCDAFRRVLKPNGSLYVFASPAMASRVEEVVRGRFNVLNHIVWRKHDGSGYDTGGHSKVAEETLRSFFPQTERVIFAEPCDAEGNALAESQYAEACAALKRRLFGMPLELAMKAQACSHKHVAEVTGAYGTVNHGGAVSNWLLGYNCPTAEQYAALQRLFGVAALPCPYSVMRAGYEAAKVELEEPRTRFDALRRPFYAPADVFTDVWDFPTVSGYPGKHPCEKPLSLMQHIVSVSSREGDTVFDPFCGSGTTGEAALRLGREVILGDASEHWSAYAAGRLERRFGSLPGVSGRARPTRHVANGQAALFGETP